jgi:predicted AAA+ superfamily ATPase
MKKIELEKLILFDNVRRDALAAKTARIFGALFCEAAGLSADEEAVRLYYEVQRELLAKRADAGADVPFTYWRRHVLRLVAEAENAFSLSAERGEDEPPMRALAAAEMPALKALYAFDWKRAAAALGGGAPCASDMRPPAAHGAPLSGGAGDENAFFALDLILRMPDDAEAAAALAAHYARAACGMFGRSAVFSWKQGRLAASERPDPVSFDDLIGYDLQKKMIIENTEFFLGGRPYSNMLLYGDRGTGKSSSVKALSNMFKARGLRLVALPKSDIGALPALMDLLAPRGCKFIIFIDDLSFEENETGYKAFKSALEGGVHAQPANTLVCVTSNRRGIVKEFWSERLPRTDVSRGDREDINPDDALQEKRSLADRFGLTVTFSAPTGSEYLDIVRGIARRAGLAADDELTRPALQWELRQGGRSGRTARQFVNRILSARAATRTEE